MPAVQHVESRDGTPIAYRATGTGEPLVLVHGGSTSSADWVLLARLLRDRFTVVSMDRRGRGRSGDGPDYSMQREAEDVAAILDAVGGRVLVGHSYGALCCILAARQRPDLRRLVVYEPPIALCEHHLEGLDERMAANDLNSVVEDFLRMAGAPDDQLGAIRASPAWDALLDAVPALPRELRAAVAWKPPSASIGVPTLFLLGADTSEPIYLEGLDEVMAAFGDVRLERIPGQRHIAHVFAAPVFAELIAGFCGDQGPPAK